MSHQPCTAPDAHRSLIISPEYKSQCSIPGLIISPGQIHRWSMKIYSVRSGPLSRRCFIVNSFGSRANRKYWLRSHGWCNRVVHERANTRWMGVAPCDLVYIFSSSSLPVGWGSFRGPRGDLLQSLPAASTRVGPPFFCLSFFPSAPFSFSSHSSPVSLSLSLLVYFHPLLFPMVGQQCLMLRNIECAFTYITLAVQLTSWSVSAV